MGFFEWLLGPAKKKERKGFSKPCVRKRVRRRGSTCERCGRRVRKYHVHHRDRDRSNCDCGNAQILCPGCHREVHRRR
jgi:hypothetical protein